MGGRVDRHLAAGAHDADARFQRRRHLADLDRVGFLHALGPELEALVGAHRQLGDVRVVLAEALVEALLEGLVLGCIEVLEVVVRQQKAIGLFGRQHDVLVAHREGGGGQWNFLGQAGRRPLAVERHVRAADQRRDHHVGLGRLDLGDGRAEGGHVEREEVDRSHRAAVLDGELLDPLRGDLAVVVVGRDDVDLLAPFLHRVGDQLAHRLRRCHAGAEGAAVADTALVLGVVEVQRLVLVEHRPDHFARRRGDAAVHHRHLVFQRGLLRELRIHLHVRLRVVADQLELLAQQAAGSVLLLDGQRQRIEHRLAVDVEATRQVVDAADADFVGGQRRQRQDQRRGAGYCSAGRFDEGTTVHGYLLKE